MPRKPVGHAWRKYPPKQPAIRYLRQRMLLKVLMVLWRVCLQWDHEQKRSKEKAA